MIVSRWNLKAQLRIALSVGGAALLALATGCHTLQSASADPLASTAKTAAAQTEQSQPANAVQVEFHPESGKPERKSVPLNGDLHVQEVMQQINGYKRFSRVKMQLVRRSPAGNTHKMDIAYDRSKRTVDPQTDYHLHPNDVIIVTEDTSGPITDFLNKTLGSPSGRAAKQMVSG